jgi:hypothetical protein
MTAPATCYRTYRPEVSLPEMVFPRGPATDTIRRRAKCAILCSARTAHDGRLAAITVRTCVSWTTGISASRMATDESNLQRIVLMIERRAASGKWSLSPYCVRSEVFEISLLSPNVPCHPPMAPLSSQIGQRQTILSKSWSREISSIPSHRRRRGLRRHRTVIGLSKFDPCATIYVQYCAKIRARGGRSATVPAGAMYLIRPLVTRHFV